MRTEREIEREMVTVAKADFPYWYGSPWKLVGKGSEALDKLAAEAKAVREIPSSRECERLDREMKLYREEGR